MKKPSFETFLYFIKAYPLRSFVILVTLLFAGVIETIGIGALLPLLNVIIGAKENTEPNMLTQAINSIFEIFRIEQSFTNFLVIIVVTICLKAVVIYNAMKIVAFAAIDITKDMRVNLIQLLMGAKWQYYNSLPAGKSATAMASEAEQCGQFFMLTGKVVAAVVQAIIYTIIVVLVDWKVSFLAIFFGGLGAFCFKSLVQMARHSGVKMAESLQSLIVRLNESLLGAKPLKAMGEEGRFIALLEKDIADVNKSKKKQIFSNLLLKAFQEPLLIILISCGLYWAYTYAQYPIAELLLIAFLFHRLITQINMVQNYYQKSINYEGAVRSILKFTQNAKENHEVVLGQKKPALSKAVYFKDVSLSYGDNVVLNNFNGEIPARKLSVIFGPSGVGKSTLLDVTLGLITPDSGQVLIDDTPLEEIDIKEWRHLVGYVPQETFLFHDTILQNITLGDSKISEEKVIEALKISKSWEFVQNTEEGVFHVVGERGAKLSGGQRQRLALARALVRDPEVLILDEATAGLDKESENLILGAFQKMLKTTTIISISHDPKILDIASHVIRLEK